jgi:hypothetical protein
MRKEADKACLCACVHRRAPRRIIAGKLRAAWPRHTTTYVRRRRASGRADVDRGGATGSIASGLPRCISDRRARAGKVRMAAVAAPFVDVSQWSLATRDALQRYETVVEALNTSVKPLFKEVAIDTSNPMFCGDTPNAFLAMIIDKIDSTCLGLQCGLDSLRTSLQSALPINIVASLLTVGGARSIRIRVNLTAAAFGEEPWFEDYVLAKTTKRRGGAGSPGTTAVLLTCTTSRFPWFWGRVSTMVLGKDTRDPINYCVPEFAKRDTVDVTRKENCVPLIDSETGEPFTEDLYRFAHRLEDATGVEKFIGAIANTRPFALEVFSTVRAGTQRRMMEAFGAGDGSVILGQ